MEAKFTKATEVKNFVYEVFDLDAFDLGLDAEMAADPAASAGAAPPNRIVVERIGHARHWRA